MIRGLHGMIYSSDAEASRAFFRDQVKLPFTDVGGGWMIFDLPEADLGFHPTDQGGTAGAHEVSLYCDDIRGTVADLRSRGVEFKGEISDQGYGFVTHFLVPGGITIQLYQPKYQKQRRPGEKAKAAVKRTVARVRQAADRMRGKAAAASAAKAGAAAKKPAAKAKAKKPVAKAKAKKPARR